MHGTIYCVTNRLNGLRYIGQTHLTLSRRRQKHIDSVNCGSDSYFHNAVRKHGIDNFDFVEIDAADSQAELDYMENYWIEFYQTRIRTTGYNTKGGGQLNGGTLNDSIKAKISVANTGRKRSPEARAKMSARKKGIPNPAHGERMKRLYKERPEIWMGRSHTEAAKQLFSIQRQGKRYSPGTEFPSVSVRCVETDEVFPSVSAAARHIDVNSSCFYHLKAHPHYCIGGFHWVRSDAESVKT